MPRQRRLLFVTMLVVLAIVLCIALFGWRWNQTGYLTLDDGRRVPDVPEVETGRYASAEYTHLRRRYLQSFEWYKTLPTLPIRVRGDAVEGGDEVRRLVRTIIGMDPASVQSLQRLGSTAANDLEHAVVLVFARLAGLSLEEYRRRMIQERSWSGPPRLPEHWDRMPGSKASDDPSAAFASWYAQWNLKHAAVTGVASDPAGWRAVVGRRSTRRGGNEYLRTLGPDDPDFEHFGGGISSRALIFHRWPEDWDEFSRTRSDVTQAEIMAVVQTIAGDRHPVSMVFVFDDETSRWRLTHFTQRVTVRVARTGGLAF